jgi:uncharacterized membrane protein YkvA (DUF1232 family)
MRAIQRWKQSARKLKRETYALYLAARHPCTPWYAKLFIICIAGYALSPIDLIPDFIPLLGYLDDLVIVPFGIGLALKMLPTDVLEECRQRAYTELGGEKPKSWASAVVIAAIWLVSLGLVGVWVYRRIHSWYR